MTRERTVLLVVHTGREEATETARRVEKVLDDNGIGLRVLTAEAVDRGSLHLTPDDMRALGVDIQLADADPNAADGCELVLGLGGDGTVLRAAELARTVSGLTAQLERLRGRLDVTESAHRLTAFFRGATAMMVDFARICGRSRLADLDRTNLASLDPELARQTDLEWVV